MCVGEFLWAPSFQAPPCLQWHSLAGQPLPDVCSVPPYSSPANHRTPRPHQRRGPLLWFLLLHIFYSHLPAALGWIASSARGSACILGGSWWCPCMCPLLAQPATVHQDHSDSAFISLSQFASPGRAREASIGLIGFGGLAVWMTLEGEGAGTEGASRG